MSPIPVQNMDQTEAWEGGGGILPPGKHLVTITEESDDTVSSGGNPQITLQFTADDGQGIKDWIAVVPPKPDGSGGTYGKVRQLFEACGLQVPSGPNAMLSSAPLLAKKLLITVQMQPSNQFDESGQPKMRSRVVAYEAAGNNGGGVTPSANAYANVGQGANAVNDDIPF